MRISGLYDVVCSLLMRVSEVNTCTTCVKISDEVKHLIPIAIASHRTYVKYKKNWFHLNITCTDLCAKVALFFIRGGVGELAACPYDKS